jgi:hypothetical protein
MTNQAERGPSMVRRLVAVSVVVALTLIGAGSAIADPPNETVFPMTCDDGTVVNITLGAPPNQSSNVFVVDESRMFVAKTLEVLDGFGNVVYEFDRGSKGFRGKDLLTCSLEAFDLFFTATGFFTPR